MERQPEWPIFALPLRFLKLSVVISNVVYDVAFHQHINFELHLKRRLTVLSSLLALLFFPDDLFISPSDTF